LRGQEHNPIREHRAVKVNQPARQFRYEHASQEIGTGEANENRDYDECGQHAKENVFSAFVDSRA
jgi:hypothetical protein